MNLFQIPIIWLFRQLEMSGSLTDVNKHLHLTAPRNLIYAYIPYATHEILIYLFFLIKNSLELELLDLIYS